MLKSINNRPETRCRDDDIDMPYRKEQFVTGEFYHIVIRGIDENRIFKDINDHYRGIFSIYEFNNAKAVAIKDRRKVRLHFKKILKKAKENPPLFIDYRDKLVELAAFCFMPNHLHLLIRQLKDGGITKFMRKLGAGYGRYFNTKYKRKGHVFQNTFLAIHIKNDRQLKIVFAYIHSNALSLIMPKWKERGIKKLKEAIQFIENYKWSSYQDYIGRQNFPSVTERKFLLELMSGEKGCKNFMEDWLKYRGKVKEEEFNKLMLE
ncbi:MAG: transposase [Patescibacteria group bacterium]